MNDKDFLRVLNSMDFPAKYWALCDRFPTRDVLRIPLKGKTRDVIDAFRAAGASVRYASLDRSFQTQEERIGGLQWSAVLVKQRSGGVELLISGEGNGVSIGSTFADLAYQAKQLSDPGFRRDPFTGPPPYPRPAYNNDPEALKALVSAFVGLVSQVTAELRRHAAAAV